MVDPSVFAETEDRMKKALDSLKRDFSAIRTGRATPQLLDRVQVEAYGAVMPVNQVGTVSVPEPRLLLVQPFDKSLIGAIERAIQKSDLGVNPTNDGSAVRIALPPLNEDRRKDLVKQCKKRAEEGKVTLRNLRREANELLKKQKDSGASEDEIKRAEQQIQKMVDKFIQDFDSHTAAKEKEILEV